MDFSRTARVNGGMQGRSSFVTGFGVTCGALAALAIAGILSVVVDRFGQHRDDPGMVASAKMYALQALRRHGIKALSRETAAGEVDGEWVVSGPAVDRDNRVCEVFASFRVATVGKTKRWQLLNVSIDGEQVVIDGDAFD